MGNWVEMDILRLPTDEESRENIEMESILLWRRYVNQLPFWKRKRLNSVAWICLPLGNSCAKYLFLCLNFRDPPGKLAIIVSAEPALKKVADAISVQGHSIGDLVCNENSKGSIEADASHWKTCRSPWYEIIAAVILADEGWIQQNVDHLDSVLFTTR